MDENFQGGERFDVVSGFEDFQGGEGDGGCCWLWLGIFIFFCDDNWCKVGFQIQVASSKKSIIQLEEMKVVSMVCRKWATFFYEESI